MKPIDFHQYFQKNAEWVDWDTTTDVFLYGDPQIEIRRTAVTWLATNAVIRAAAEAGCNFLVCHEGAFYPQLEKYPSEQHHFAEKRKLLADLGVTLYRCHDSWDRFPTFGIVDSWAEYLGFQTEPRDASSFYRVCLAGGSRASEIAERLLEKTDRLGQKWVSIMGDPKRIVNRLVVGTGAITRLPEMAEVGGDLFLTTDDGMHSTYNGLWFARSWAFGDHSLSFNLGNPRHDEPGGTPRPDISGDEGRLSALWLPSSRVGLNASKLRTFHFPCDFVVSTFIIPAMPG